jgi:hypothetical protein
MFVRERITMITHILEHYLFLMTCGNGQKVAWQAHDKCAAKKLAAAFVARIITVKR